MRERPRRSKRITTFSPQRVGRIEIRKIRTFQVFGGNVSILRNSPFADIEFRENLDPNHKILVKPFWDFERLVEHAIDAVAHPSHRLARLDVNVAGIGRSGFFEKHFLNADDRRAFSANRTSLLARNYCWKLRHEL